MTTRAPRICQTAEEAFAAGQRLLALATQGPTRKNGRPAA